MGSDDAFGAALLDWVTGGSTSEVIERDDGYVEDGAGPDAYIAPLAGWPDAEREAVLHVRGRVLDAGCGAGRVALVLQQRGLEVVGIDESRLAVRAARHFGVRQVRCASITVLAREIASFDSVILFGNNFGIFGTPERARRSLTAWARRAAPGTRIFAESTNAYTGGAPIIDRGYYRANQRRGLAPGTTRMRFRYGELVGPWLNWLFVSQGEMRQIVRGTGWTVAEVLGAGPSEPYVAILERR